MSFKVAIIGAGSVGFTKTLISDLLCVPEFSDCEFALTDINAHNLDMIKQIIDKTAKYFALSPSEICSAQRDKHIVTPRQIAMYLLRSELHLSFPKIANELGRKDHTTAIHSIEKIEKSIKLDFTIREQVSEIRERLYV